jgi:hypothetical protein
MGARSPSDYILSWTVPCLIATLICGCNGPAGRLHPSAHRMAGDTGSAPSATTSTRDAMDSILRSLPNSIPRVQLVELWDSPPPAILALYSFPKRHPGAQFGEHKDVAVSFEEYATGEEAERRLFEITARPWGHTSEENAGDTKIYRWSQGNIASRVNRCVITVDPLTDLNAPPPPGLEDIFKYCVRNLKELYGIKS